MEPLQDASHYLLKCCYHSLYTSLRSGTTKCSTITLYLACPHPEISHFSREFGFLVVEKGIYKLCSGHWVCSLLIGHHCSQGLYGQGLKDTFTSVFISITNHILKTMRLVPDNYSHSRTERRINVSGRVEGGKLSICLKMPACPRNSCSRKGLGLPCLPVPSPGLNAKALELQLGLTSSSRDLRAWGRLRISL